jgi:cell division protein FtsB
MDDENSGGEFDPGIDKKEIWQVVKLGQKIMVGTVLAIMLNLMLWIVFGDNGWVELSRLKEKRQAAIEQNEILAAENVDLYRIIERLKHDPVYIESVARNELGMVGKEDVVVIGPWRK